MCQKSNLTQLYIASTSRLVSLVSHHLQYSPEYSTIVSGTNQTPNIVIIVSLPLPRS